MEGGEMSPPQSRPISHALQALYVWALRRCFDRLDVFDDDRCDLGTAILCVYRMIVQRRHELKRELHYEFNLLHSDAAEDLPLELLELEWDRRLVTHQSASERSTSKAELQRGVITALLSAAVIDLYNGGDAAALDEILATQARRFNDK